MQILKPGITKHDSEHLWFLTTENTSYVVGVEIGSGILLNLHWGSRLVTIKDIELPITLPQERSSQDPSITAAYEEYPVFGGLRYGPDLLRVKFENGTRELDLTFVRGAIEDNQLIIDLVDRSHSHFQVQLMYSVDIKNDIIVRNASLIGANAEEKYRITKAQTAAWHIPPPMQGSQRELVTLAGEWANETQVQKHSVQPGTSHVLGSTRGIPSAQAYPYFALKDTASDGEHNDCQVYFGTLGWSGNWEIQVHTDISGKTTVTGGLHDRDFVYTLQEASFELPTFVAGYTTHGLSGARTSLHHHIRNNKDTSLVEDQVSPVLYNGWESCIFDVNIENQKSLANTAADLGAELFVVDDGWFKGRTSDHAGLGDWYEDKRKFPDGLKPLADHVHDLGMQFGLWFEPEMVNPNSNLYRKHPDWVYHYPDRPRHLERNQLVLDITKKQVRQYLVERMLDLIDSVGIDFIKWDMNRPISEAGSDVHEQVWIKHVHAFHDLISTIKRSSNKIRIESCCSGGGRADLSILKKVESCWPSDNTRPDARTMIQYGASFVIPPDMLSCWVTDSPNDDPFTNIPISYRFHVSFMGALGIGSDMRKLSKKELDEYKGWVTLYKSLRHILQKGNLQWLVVPASANAPSTAAAYTAVTQTSTKNESVVLAFREKSPFWRPVQPLKLRSLMPLALYTVTLWHTDPEKHVFKQVISGASLLNKGIKLPYLDSKSYSSVVMHVQKISTHQ